MRYIHRDIFLSAWRMLEYQSDKEEDGREFDRDVVSGQRSRRPHRHRGTHFCGIASGRRMQRAYLPIY